MGYYHSCQPGHLFRAHNCVYGPRSPAQNLGTHGKNHCRRSFWVVSENHLPDPAGKSITGTASACIGEVEQSAMNVRLCQGKQAIDQIVRISRRIGLQCV